MSGAINIFMSKELTCLPSLIDNYVSKHYNNALGNALSWSFFMWLFVHIGFDKFINALLRQMKYPEYVRNRITTTLWNFGFCAGSFIYCFAALSRSNFNFAIFYKTFLLKESQVVPSQYVLGFVILSTFYAQSAIWDGNLNGLTETTVNHVILLIFSILAYGMGWTDLMFALVSATSFVQCTLELGRTFSFQVYNRVVMKMLSAICFIAHLIFCVFLYFVAIPLYFLIPCGKNFNKDVNIPILILNLLLWVWFLINISHSALFKVVKHYIYHIAEEDTGCEQTILDCCMFAERTDTAYSVMLLRKRIETRKENLILKRKKPNRIALYQTLKCMVTVKRKLKQKRSANIRQPENIVQIAASTTDSSSENVTNSVNDSLLDNVDKQAVEKVDSIVD